MRNHKRPFGQRAISALLAMLMLAGSAWGADGMTARASVTDLWEDGYVDDSDLFEDEDLYGNSDLENDTDYGLFSESSNEDIFEDESAAVLEDEDNGVSVTVEGDSDALSDVESVRITDLGREAVEQWQAMFDAQGDDVTYKVVSVYDITLVDWHGNETEPDGAVDVSLSGDIVSNAILDDRELTVYHAPDEAAVSEDADVSEVVTEVYSHTSGYESVDFTTDSFSQYALVLTGSDTQRQVSFGDNEYLELDKYLRTTGEMNGQNTYDIYLEQAYYDPDPGVKLPNAPIRSDFFLLMDHSASMSDSPAINLNVAIDTFLKQIQKNNNNRVIRAAEGEYYDIDPADVADANADGTYTLKDEATIKSVMGEHLQYLTGALGYNNRVDVRLAPSNRVAIYNDDERTKLLDLTNWEQGGRYYGKLGTDWGGVLGHKSTAADYGSGLLLTIPDYGSSSTICYCVCDACKAGRTYTDNCDAKLVQIDGKPGHYKCSVHGLPSDLPDRYKDGYPADGNCMVRVTKERNHCLSSCSACANGSCVGCTRKTPCLDSMTRTDMATGQLYNWIFNNSNGGTEAYTTRRYNPETDKYDGEKIYTPKVVLATDGAPAGYSDPNPGDKTGTGFVRDGFDLGVPYDYVTGEGNSKARMFWNVCPSNANNALAKINAIKNLQPDWVITYVTYLNMESDPDAKVTLDQLYYEAGYDENGNPRPDAKNVDLGRVWNAITKRSTKSLTSIFMLLYSSCAQNGSFVSSDDITKNITNYVADANSQGYTPNYFKFYNNAMDIPQLQDIVDSDDMAASKGASSNGGYANYDSYVLDEITDPFEITSVSDIRVYAVPRIPANMNADGTVNDLVECYADGCDLTVGEDVDNYSNNPNCGNHIACQLTGEDAHKSHGHGLVSYAVGTNKEVLSTTNIQKTMSFRWGEQYIDVGEDSEGPDTEWVDVTEKVNIVVEGNTVKVTNYNYEANAVSDFDKDQFRRWPITGNGTVYKTGDYGYKLVVVIPINAKTTFGGNGIRTNNSDVSGFYPSEPTREDLPKWILNTDKNPNGKEYMELYPECKVDLNVTYNIVKDDAIIYAPQTQRLHDLVTDTVDMLWYRDPSYSDLQTIRDNAKTVYDDADTRYKALRDTPPEDGADDVEWGVWEEELNLLLIEKNEAQKAYLEASENLAQCPAYIPDGINNAFVNISYELYDPDGTKVGTMTIPHGKAYVKRGDDTTNIDWTFTGGADMLITKSGKYRIKAVVTPVDTEQSPTWHVYTENDSTDMRGGRSDSTQYSPTGSSAVGSQSAITIEKEPEAQIFTLEITADDSRQEHGETIDFMNLQGYIQNLADDQYNKHIVGYRWVCTNPAYTSKQENEPGYNKTMMVGPDGVRLVAQVPDAAFTDKLVKDSMGLTVIEAEDGKYVPAAVILTRTCGDLNKSVGTTKQVEQRTLLMTDDDKLYDGISSVKWIHKCSTITEYDCGEQEFKQSHKYDTDETADGKGKVRFLVHVLDNPNVTPVKSTTTPTIAKGMDIEWQISAVNNDNTVNPYHRSSEFSLFDIFPYQGDVRTSDSTGHEGTNSKTDTYVKSIVVDYSKSSNALLYVESGKGVLYYTTDEKVRTADPEGLSNPNALDPVKWTKAEAKRDGNKISYNIPADVVVNVKAIRLDTRLAWNESVTVDMVGNVGDLSKQENGDNYNNDAKTYNGKTIKNSNVVETTVSAVGLSGTVWIDEDNNGLIGNDEPRKDKVRITLYQEYDSKNPLNASHKRVVDGKTLVPAYDTNFDMYPSIITGEDGSFLFEDIQQGKYYIIADLIPEDYEMTKQRAGKDDANSAKIDSEAEEKFIDSFNTGIYAQDGHSAWIKEVTVGVGIVRNQNFGLRSIKGSVRVGKIATEIHYPSSMTDEERASYRVPFTFVLKNTKTGAIYTKSISLGQEDHHAMGGMPQVWTDDSYIKSFYDLPLGTYELYETESAVYHLKEVKLLEGDSSKVRFDKDSRKATIEITPACCDFVIEVTNEPTPPVPGGDENGVRNLVSMKTPVKLELKYVGADPISSKTLTEYTFQASDFDPDKGGDMIVTYDDGSTISISAGTLRFDQVTFSPAKVTNDMNTPEGNKLAITGYYSERGHLVTDSFRVGIDLKPVHKFYIDFNANGSKFKEPVEDVNHVTFAYDVQQNKNMVTGGTYKDVPNGGLTNLSGFRFAGWNTKADGTGTQYGALGSSSSGSTTDALAALDALGLDASFSGSTLYARWRTNITFDANGGTIDASGVGLTDAEKALHGKTSGSIEMDKGAKPNTGMTAKKSGYHFVMWNSKKDGTGKDLASYGVITGPTTFYAIYYQSDYAFTGTVQTFTAPVSGIYEFELWGSPGGGQKGGTHAGPGGYTKFYMEVKSGQGKTCSDPNCTITDVHNVHIFVGGSGSPQTGNSTMGGWNGGGAVTTCKAGAHAGTGGGMTHVSYTNNLAVADASPTNKNGHWNPTGTIGCAGGGGGAADSNGNVAGGAGGGKTAGNGKYDDRWKHNHFPSGATQTTGYTRGIGEPCANGAGAGGGWYGGFSTGQTVQTQGGRCAASGGGGSGYICPAGEQTKYTSYNLCLVGTDASIPKKPNTGSALGVHGYVRIILKDRL